MLYICYIVGCLKAFYCCRSSSFCIDLMLRILGLATHIPIFGHSCSFESEISTCSSWHSLRTLLPLLPSAVALTSLSLPWLASRLLYGYWPQPRQCRRPQWSLGLQFLQQRHWWKSAKALVRKDTQYVFSSHKSVVFLNKVLWFFHVQVSSNVSWWKEFNWMAFNSTLDQSFLTWTLLLLTCGTEYFFIGRDCPEPCMILVNISLLTTCQ